MAVADEVPVGLKSYAWVVTAVLSILGYVLVVGTFAGLFPIFPDLSRDTVIFLGDAIALTNFLALSAIVAGVYFIRRNEVRKHQYAMLAAFTLIVLFLVMYLVKIGGGFEKAIQASGLVWGAYVAMLGIHILLSAVSVPVVLHAVVLGLTHTPSELRDTSHARVGRIAVAAWGLSLFLGLVTYLMLNFVYGWTPRAEVLFLLAVPRIETLWRS